jgi:hypothetical protein
MVAGSIIAMLILLEVGLRLYAGVPVLRIANFIRDRVDRAQAAPHSAYDEQLGWVTKPNTHGRHFNSDQYGIRLAGRVDRPVPQGAILAVGDSFTYGEEVDDDETWPAALETMTGTPVINASATGWGTDQIVMRAEAMIEVAHPKILIVSFFWGDIGRAEYQIDFGGQKPYYTVEAGELVLHNIPVPRFPGMVREVGRVRAVLGYSYTFFWLGQRLGSPQWLYGNHVEFMRATPPGTGAQIACLLLKRLKERTEREQIRLLLVMQYGHADFPGNRPAQAVAALDCAGSVGVEALDTWARLAEIEVSDHARFDSLFNFYQGVASHMSPAGNRLIAAEIATRLQAGH